MDEHLELCDYLKLSNQEREIVSLLHRAHSLFKMPKSAQDKLEKIEWAKFYASPFGELSLKIVAARYSPEEREQFLTEHDARIKQLSRAITRLREKTPILRAEDLIRAGISPGKQMGLLLNEAERIAINEEIEEPDALIARLQATPLWTKLRLV
ncbi:MAG: hypothetical protein ACHQT8_02110 [Chlamydiales bacterium]